MRPPLRLLGWGLFILPSASAIAIAWAVNGDWDTVWSNILPSMTLSPMLWLPLVVVTMLGLGLVVAAPKPPQP